MRKEIEVKAKVSDREGINQKLNQLGCTLTEPAEQKDAIFVDGNYGEFDKFQPGKNLLRIRETEGKYIFTVKNPQSNEQDSFERETEIANPQEMKEALLMMGYHEAVQVYKTRRKAKYKDWEICLDEVEGLGSFIEVEKIVDEEDVDSVQKELFEFLLSLGIRPEDRVTQGYDTMVYLSKNK